MNSDQIKQLSKEQLIEIVETVRKSESEWLSDIVIGILLKGQNQVKPAEYDRYRDVINYIMANDIIHAIKTLRTITGLGLLQAKFTVEAVQNTLFMSEQITHNSQNPVFSDHKNVDQRSYSILVVESVAMRSGKI